MVKDLYACLDLSHTSTLQDIKQRYRKLAFGCHPDRNPSDEATQRFRDISEAYHILSDPQKRARYDKFGYDVIETSEPIDPMVLFSKIFNVDFGTQMSQNVFFFSDLSSLTPLQETPAHSLVYTLDVRVSELYSGTQKEFIVDSKDRMGVFHSTKYVLNIKRGTRDKEHLTVKAGGHYNPLRETDDDLVVVIHEIKDTCSNYACYTRQGDDLIRECTISLSDALCGATIRLDHFGTSLCVQISEIVKPNSLYQLWGQGMPIKRTSEALGAGTRDEPERGNLLLDLTIEFPTHLSETNQGYLRQILDSPSRNETTNESETPQDCTILQAYYYKDKEDVMKELLNEDEHSDGCIVQ
jgi:DnaJ-class molecular chaperone